MSIFDRWFKRSRPESDSKQTPTAPTSGPPASAAATPTTEPRTTTSEEPRVGRLGRVGRADGPSEQEALALLGELRSTKHEGAALAALAAAVGPLGDGVATLAAKACIDRGETAAARRFLEHTTGADAIVLAADLADETGDTAVALALIERVLARSFDHPGARERHHRWATTLGRKAAPLTKASAETTVLSAHVDSPYALRREIARGGAAAVYEAEDRELGRRVALKVYHDPSADRAQLLHEARVACDLARPGVIRVYDVDVRGGWLVLEYFAAGSLRERIRSVQSTIDRKVVFAWLPPLVATLAEVHAAGYVHLDVKPGNILLGASGEAVLADFGSARRIGEVSPPGSLGYVAPERLAGAVASVEDDLYGVGRVIQDVVAAVPGADRDGSAARLAAKLTGPARDRPIDLMAAVEDLGI